jgi:hypothetical protein
MINWFATQTTLPTLEEYMNGDNQQLEKAISDLSIIRESINHIENVDHRFFGITLKANLLLQAIAFVSCTLLLLYEVATDESMTYLFKLNQGFQDINSMVVRFIGLVIVVALFLTYFIVWRASKHDKKDIKSYLSNNFSYIQNLNFFSDLVIKYFILAVIIMTGNSVWLSPLLIAFTGDYLIQGRLFTLPLNASLILGLAFIALAAVLAYFQVFNLVWALSIFSITALSSLIYIGRKAKAQTEQS